MIMIVVMMIMVIVMMVMVIVMAMVMVMVAIVMVLESKGNLMTNVLFLLLQVRLRWRSSNSPDQFSS